MRHIHVRFKNRELIRTRFEVAGGHLIMLLKNTDGYEIVLKGSKLKRRILGVVIEDHWDGGRDRWFSEDCCSHRPWGEE